MRQESGGLSGSFAYTQKPPAGSYAALAGAGGRYAGEVVSASRRDAPVSSIAARWEGQAAVRECTLSGVRACYPFQSADVETLYLNLEQSGGQVTGDISFSGPGVRLLVSGRTDGRAVTLEGRSPGFAGGERRLNVSARLDEFGRLVGTFTHAEPIRLSPNEVTKSVVHGDLFQVLSYRP